MSMQFYEEPGKLCAHFHSIAELENTDVPSFNQHAVNYFTSRHRTYNVERWWGIPGGLRQVMEVTKHGWKDGLEKMRRTLGKLEADFPRVRAKKRRKVRRGQGNELDIHRVYAGDLPRAWNATEKVEVFPGRKRGKKVTIAVEMSASGGRHGEQLFWRGATATFLAERLTNAGYSVEVQGVITNTDAYPNGPRGSVVSITLKAYDQRLNLESLVCATGLSGFYRYYGFLAKSCLPRNVSCGMGTEYSMMHLGVPKHIQKNADHIVYVKDVWSEYEAVQFIKHHAAELLKKETTHERARRRA